MKSDKPTYIAVLHNIRSLHNVGSVFRTADGAGVGKLYLTGYTPSPVDELGRVRKEISKTALGAEHTVLWEKVQSIARVIQKLKKDGYTIVALEKTKESIDYRSFAPKLPLALVIGNEVRGISTQLLKKMDAVIDIPMRGKKESLNVSIAFGIAAYQLTSRED